MFFSRASLTVVLFLAVLSGGLCAVVFNPETWVAFRSNAAHARIVDLMDGKFTKAIDKAVNDQIPRSNSLNQIAAGVQYKLLNDAGPDVRAGCPGWLFLKEELIEFPDGKRNLAKHFDLVKKIQARFSGSKVALVLVPVPDKIGLAKTYACGLIGSSQSTEREATWKALSVKLPIQQVDLTNHWPRPGFWRTDTHWDRKGARFSANEAARVIARLTDRGDLSVRLENRGELHERIGDLTRLAQLDLTANIFGPKPDFEQDEVSEIERRGGLLDKAAAPEIILVGSSFSLNSGFRDFLEFFSAREVLQLSEAGGGFAGALLDLLKKRSSIMDQAKVVIWEWPMRYLTQPLTEEEEAFLRSPEKPQLRP